MYDMNQANGAELASQLTLLFNIYGAKVIVTSNAAGVVTIDSEDAGVAVNTN
jgi:hypothetical protein